MTIKELLESRSIEVSEDNLVCLESFYLEFIGNRKKMMGWVKGRQKSTANYHIIEDNNYHYIHTWDLCRYIKISPLKPIRMFYNDNKEIIDRDSLDKTRSVVDAKNNIFIYLGTPIEVLIRESKYYFNYSMFGFQT